MWPYLSLSRRNPHTVIWSNHCNIWSLRLFSCTPTPAYTLSNSCCSCILNAGCCWVVGVLGCFLRILRNICSLWDFYSVPYYHPDLYYVQLWVLRDVFCFRRIGGDGDRDVDGEGERRLCSLSFYFCLCRPLLGAGPSLSVVVPTLALSSLLSN